MSPGLSHCCWHKIQNLSRNWSSYRTSKTFCSVSNGQGQFLGFYVIDRVLVTRLLGQILTLCVRLSQLRLTDLFFVLFLEQPRLHTAEGQHNFLEICTFLVLISRFSLFNLEINGPDVSPELHTISSTISMGKKEKA